MKALLYSLYTLCLCIVLASVLSSSCALPERCMCDVPFTASVGDEIGRVKFPCALNEHRMVW